MTRLGEWRNSDIESYQSAYVSLVLHRFHIDQWSFSCSILCWLTALLCQDIFTNCATSPAVLVSIHINCCYIWTALVLSGAKSSTIVTIKMLKSRASFSSDLKTSQWLISKPFSSPLTASARRRPWTSSLKIPTDFSSPPSLRRFHFYYFLPTWRICVSSDFCLKVMVAKLVTIVRSGYDPVSTNQTQRLVGCMQRTLQDFPSITSRWAHISRKSQRNF